MKSSYSKAKATGMEQEQQYLVPTAHGGSQAPETRSELPLPNLNFSSCSLVCRHF